ncbi:MAG: phosphoglycerate mutase, partial [Candidatus Latescibacterota bacterium]
NITDRRAGRISTDINRKLVEKMRKISIPGVDIFVETVREHRGVVIFRKPGLIGNISETDPQLLGVPPLKADTTDGGKSLEMAAIANLWLEQVFEVLKDDHPANGILTRGWCNYPEISTFQELYGLNPACIALYPMYRGLAKFVGMQIYREGITNFTTELDVLCKAWPDHDYFFVHYKHTDSAGEDGDFDRKVAGIEEVDKALPCILDLHPDVIAVTGDHSTPAVYKAHSWHPVPVVMAGKYIRPDKVNAFNESEAVCGGLGRFEAQYLMNELLASAERLSKYGA